MLYLNIRPTQFLINLITHKYSPYLPTDIFIKVKIGSTSVSLPLRKLKGFALFNLMLKNSYQCHGSTLVCFRFGQRCKVKKNLWPRVSILELCFYVKILCSEFKCQVLAFSLGHTYGRKYEPYKGVSRFNNPFKINLNKKTSSVNKIYFHLLGNACKMHLIILFPQSL